VNARTLLEEVMTGRRKSAPVSLLLRLLSVPYAIAVRLRGFLYRSGVLSSVAVGCRVISIGNLTLGGTGKTPMTAALASFLHDHGKRPVVVSRGYGRKKQPGPIVVSDGRSLLVDAKTGGDEPFLIAKKLPFVPVVVADSKLAAARYAVENFNPGVILLDDGFQHFAIKRDLDIVLLDASNPFGNGLLFPAGVLRERLSALRRAGAIVLTRVESDSQCDLLKRELTLITQAPIFLSVHRPVDLVNVSTGSVRSLAEFRGAAVAAFAGIAQPESFFRTLKSLGVDIRVDQSFPDHHPFTKQDIAAIRSAASTTGATMIVTTEKDAARLPDEDDIWALRIEFLIQEQEAWERFLMSRL
jgi:tetraacyldisaccharide 4'-kinase